MCLGMFGWWFVGEVGLGDLVVQGGVVGLGVQTVVMGSGLCVGVDLDCAGP